MITYTKFCTYSRANQAFNQKIYSKDIDYINLIKSEKDINIQPAKDLYRRRFLSRRFKLSIPNASELSKNRIFPRLEFGYINSTPSIVVLYFAILHEIVPDLDFR